MKLRSITLDNVRRFTDPVTVGPIGDGVTLLCEPNEAGKSTLFDALHALFFIKHNSQAKDIKALRPHSGGTVSVSCELEQGGAHWRVRKDWFAGAAAKVWRDGVLLHQAEAAEDWLAGLVAGNAGGPAGLLWVRQGRVSLQTADRTEQREERDQRESLLTAISGAVEQVTGGERMDRLRRDVAAQLDGLQTSRGPRKNGRWADAEETVASLRSQEVALAALVEDLRSDLDQRRSLTSQLAALQDPEALQKRREDFAQAAQALKDAEGLSQQLKSAQTDAELAELTARSAQKEMDRCRALVTAAEKAQAEHGAAVHAQHEAAAQARTAAQQDDAAMAAQTTATLGHEQALAMLARVDAHEKSQHARQERDRLDVLIEKAQEADAQRIAQAALVAKGPDRKTLARIEGLAQQLATQHAVRDAAAPQISAQYETGAPMVTLAGAPLAPDTALPLPPDGQVTMPGIGRLHITTTDKAASAALCEAREKLDNALSAGHWPDLPALRRAAQIWSSAERAAEIAERTLETVAPDGIEALRLRHAALAAQQASDTPPDIDRGQAEAAVLHATQALTKAQTTRHHTSQLCQELAVTLAKSETHEKALHEQLTQAQQALDSLPAEDTAAQHAQVAALTQVAEKARQTARALAAKVPDITTLQARHDRLKAVAEAAAAETVRIDKQIGTLNGRIEARGNEGVEEALEDVRGRLETETSTLARVVHEKDVLVRLLGALDAARKAARETYFAPVAEELRPLLTDLWDDAELQWSDDTLLPVSLRRKGTEEALDVLSGGTQEQIAFLVRLAFARLLARSGRHAPLILDDALVYSDDERIERMFDALHSAAGDLQIIVLSCRSRAFRDLGAPRLSFTPATDG